MPAETKAWVLDTSALLCLNEAEDGAEVVERLLREWGPKGKIYASFMTLMEYYYVLRRRLGETQARRGYAELRQLPVRVVENDEELGLAAGGLKAAGLSVADAWIAATAQRLQAQLVHRDPDFEVLEDRISLKPLPYRKH